MTILCILLVVWFILLACNWTTDDGMHAILGGTLPEKRTARGVSISNVGTSALRICKVGFFETIDDARDNRNDLLKQNGDPRIDQKIARFRDHLREYRLGTHIGPTMHQIF